LGQRERGRLLIKLASDDIIGLAHDHVKFPSENVFLSCLSQKKTHTQFYSQHFHHVKKSI
jgi:hypothetical protein